jgi:hypothetical protein
MSTIAFFASGLVIAENWAESTSTSSSECGTNASSSGASPSAGAMTVLIGSSKRFANA